MNILIIGSEGFIGAHAVRYFKAGGNDVMCADIVLKDEPGYLVIDPQASDFAALFQGRRYDLCINATGAANVQFSFTYPHLDYALNTANVFYILDAIRLHDPACKFINLSSAAVYGNPLQLPIREADAIQPLSPYGYHKQYSEMICHEFYTMYKIQTISARIFSAYGEGLKKQLFWDLAKKAKAATDNVVKVWGTGKESRDFIYIEDIIISLELIFQKMEFKGQAVNIASGTETTIEEAVRTFYSFFDTGDKKIKIVFSGDEKEGDPKNWRADISAMAQIGFKHKTDLPEGLKRVAEWIKDHN